MWRYYELLTDASMEAIGKMKQEVADGRWHPMEAKKQLAQTIVNDFHQHEYGATAAENWAKQFQKDEVPEELEAVEIQCADVISEGMGAASGVQPIGELVEDSRPVRVDKLIRRAGLATSNTEAAAKIKGGAVSIAGEGVHVVVVNIRLNEDTVLRVGRRMKKVRIVSDSDR